MAVEAEPSPRSTEGTQETKLAIAVEDEIFRLSPHYVLFYIMLALALIHIYPSRRSHTCRLP